MLITNDNINTFEAYLIKSEKESNTVTQYMRFLRRLADWLGNRAAEKTLLLEYKEMLAGKYKPASVNAALAAINGFFAFFERYELKLKLLRLQKKIFSEPERELTGSEYERLIGAAKRADNMRLVNILRTIRATGIRVSELKFITVEAAKRGEAEISCKGKYRRIIIAEKLCGTLLAYAAENDIQSGCIFITRTGRPVDRSNIAREMKRLADNAGVAKAEVFPHNLRHLFARVY